MLIRDQHQHLARFLIVNSGIWQIGLLSHITGHIRGALEVEVVDVIYNIYQHYFIFSSPQTRTQLVC